MANVYKTCLVVLLGGDEICSCAQARLGIREGLAAASVCLECLGWAVQVERGSQEGIMDRLTHLC